MIISVTLRGLERLIQQLEQYPILIEQKAGELCSRLAEIGAINVSIQFSRALYTGPMDHNVAVEETPEGHYQIIVSGECVAFVEFGTGMHDGVHPLESELGMHPGSWSDGPMGKHHWNDPRGWYLPKDKWAADGTRHTFGNPANMPVYNTGQDLRREVERVAREVFSS